MSKGVEKATLCRFLEKHDVQYFGKVLELRDSVTGWLAYTIQTFPHYTRHTVEHSEEIIFKLSSMLFERDDPDRPTIPDLSATEAYIIIASAYLHDSGMVVSDNEKSRLLASSEWVTWVSEESTAQRYAKIDLFRKTNSGLSQDVRNFLADVELRRLIAEFFRQRHHLRAGEVVEQHQATLGRFAFDDPVLRKTIADVCISHGLDRHELEDSVRFPFSREIRRDKVNVRLLAILLRLGDLLDMSYDRACPLLLSAASPLPAESLPHWTQYSVIEHQNVSPQKIELRACCNNQEEHRTLYDWCKWIEDEVKFANLAMSRSSRHGGWAPPFVKVGNGGTIEILRSASSNYLFRSWHFHMDQTQVLKLLTRDLYSNPLAYLRELTQNSLDAMRCRLQLNVSSENGMAFFPEKAPEEERKKFPLEIGVEWRDSSVNGRGRQQVFYIEDSGVGMSQDVIEQYFLQIGRSYYSSAEFKRKYGFFPANGYGIGFLSVFSVSEKVRVETRAVNTENAAISFTMHGPRGYLITEEGTRRIPGTRIEVTLNTDAEWQPGGLTLALRSLCPRIEFPLRVNDFGEIKEIESENSATFYSRTDLPDNDGTIEIRAFPYEENDLSGEVYLMILNKDGQEDWTFGASALTYAEARPYLQLPKLPPSLLMNRGLALDDIRRYRHILSKCYSLRLDYRGSQRFADLTRADTHKDGKSFKEIAASAARKIVQEHIRKRCFEDPESRWKYIHRLVGSYEDGNILDSINGTIPLYINGSRQLCNIEQFFGFEEIGFVMLDRTRSTKNPNRGLQVPENHGITSPPCLVSNDFLKFSTRIQSMIWERYVPKTLTLANQNLFVLTLEKSSNQRGLDLGHYASGYACDFNFPDNTKNDVIAISLSYQLDRILQGWPILLNKSNEFTQWMLRVQGAVERDECSAEQANRLFKVLGSLLQWEMHDLSEMTDAKDFLEKWNYPLAEDNPLRAPQFKKEKTF